VALGEDEVVVVGQVRALKVITEVAGGEDRDQVGGGHARGGMPRAGLGAGADAVDADLLSDLTHEIERRERACLDAAGHRHWIDLR
jgi:hypothetical protein